MKFITEEYLRDLYKKEPFTSYELNMGERLTPGARQYLSDRGINMFDTAAKKPEKPPTCQIDWKKKKLLSKLKSTEALFLIAGNEMLNSDVIWAQRIIDLGKKFSNVKDVAEGKITIESHQCHECTGINSDNFYDDLGDCFEVTDFHMHLEKSKELFTLNYLRSSLGEIEPIVLEVYEGEKNETERNIIGYVNSIINSLSQVICLVVGGSKCQRII